MKLNLIEKIVLKIFKKTFEKVYKMGLTDSFNFMQGSSFTSPKNRRNFGVIHIKKTRKICN